MKKKFQITSSGGEVKVIVRITGKSRVYKNLTWSTMSRLDRLSYQSKHRITTVTSPSGVDVFIHE